MSEWCRKFQMLRCILDTNVWVEICRGRLSPDFLETVRTRLGATLVWAPPVLVELFSGVVKSGQGGFAANKSMFLSAERVGLEILELPIPFMWKVLWNVSGGHSDVRPVHYRSLIGMLLNSQTFAQFLHETEAPGSAWKGMADSARIHDAVVSSELGFLGPLGDHETEGTLSLRMAERFRLGGLMPDPIAIENTCSAALEFLRSSLDKVRNRANPRKNDRGIYVDFQMFWYLADTSIALVTNEDFSHEIRRSPQRTRIVGVSKLL